MASYWLAILRRLWRARRPLLPRDGAWLRRVLTRVDQRDGDVGLQRSARADRLELASADAPSGWRSAVLSPFTLNLG